MREKECDYSSHPSLFPIAAPCSPHSPKSSQAHRTCQTLFPQQVLQCHPIHKFRTRICVLFSSDCIFHIFSFLSYLVNILKVRVVLFSIEIKFPFFCKCAVPFCPKSTVNPKLLSEHLLYGSGIKILPYIINVLP